MISKSWFPKSIPVLLALALSLAYLGCARAPIKDSSQAMRLSSLEDIVGQEDPGPLSLDDADMESLLEGLAIQIKYWQAKPLEQNISFGPTSITVAEYLEALLGLQAQSSSKENFFDYIKTHFDVYEVYGGDDWGEVMVTGYFEPLLKGSRKPTKELSQPLYQTPPDLVNVDMSAYALAFPHWSPFENWVSEQKSLPGLIRGRLVKSKEKNVIPKIIPYYSREEIDVLKNLKGQSLELVFVDPIDAFFLQIQGSGQVELANGEKLRLGYAAQNGHPYVPIGKFLTDIIPLEEMSMQRIESHLRILSVEERQEILNKNPSFVFFTPLKGRALTYAGTEVVNGRTIATDWRHFPKGTLALLKFQKPVNGELNETLRLVFDQDTGGAIRGPHRVDLFCGQGPEAKEMAGVMRHSGSLAYLVPKKAARLSSLKNGPNGRN